MLLLLLLDLSITAQVRRRRRRCWCHRCRRRRRNCPRRRRFAAVLLAVFQLGLLPGRRRLVLRGSFFAVGQLVLEMIVFDRAAAHRAWNFAAAAAATIVSKVKITVDDGCDGGRNTVAASTVTITTTAATIALRNKDAVGVAVAGAGRS